MRPALFFLFALLVSYSGFAQEKPEPVSWTVAYKALNDKEGEVVLTGILQRGWHTYSQKLTDAGPINTILSFTPSQVYALNGKA